MSLTTDTVNTANAPTLTTDLPPDQWEFSVLLRSANGGPELARANVTEADLLDLQYELWRDECLRKARPDISFDSLQFRLGVQREEGSGSRSVGLQLRSQTSSGGTFGRDFGTDVFADAAMRTRQKLINEKAIKLDDPVSYELHARQRAATADAVLDDHADFVLTPQSDQSAIDHVMCPLPPLLNKAKVIGEPGSAFPVIYVEETLARAEQFARRGATSNPPIESGGVLIGLLCSCPETGEFYVVVCQVLEVQDADEATFSLSYTDKSWTRIQTIVQAMRSQESSRAYQIVGQCHGHNFPPAGGAPPCDACLTQKECHRRSDAASVDDRIWTQATFSRTPWALCHIFGTNARQENVQNLFTLQNNQLQPRGFYVVEEFSTEQIVPCHD